MPVSCRRLCSLLGIAKIGRVEFTLAELAEALGVSRPTAYRLLSELYSEGLVERAGSRYRVSAGGLEELRKVMGAIGRFLGYPGIVVLTGRVLSGLGEGRYYMSLRGYVEQIEEKLGFRPYPGTLNVRLERDCLYMRRYLDVFPGIRIEGFSDGVRTYGSVKCFRATINGVESAVVIPERTHYGPDVIEVISMYNLRERLGLRDDDRVEIRVEVF